MSNDDIRSLLVDWELFQKRFSPRTDRMLLKRALELNFEREPDTTLIWSGQWNYERAKRLCELDPDGKLITLEMLVQEQDPAFWDLMEKKTDEDPTSVVEIWTYLSRRFVETARGNIRTQIIGTNIPDEIAHLAFDQITAALEASAVGAGGYKKAADVFFKERIAGKIEMVTVLGVRSDDPTMRFTYDFLEPKSSLDPIELQLSSLPWEDQLRNDCIDILDAIGKQLGTDMLVLTSHRVRWFRPEFWKGALFVQIECRDRTDNKVSLFGVLLEDKKQFYPLHKRIQDIYNINKILDLHLRSENVPSYISVISCVAEGPMGVVPLLGTIPWNSNSTSGVRFLKNLVGARVPPRVVAGGYDGPWEIEGCMRLLHDGHDSGPLLTNATVHHDGRVVIDHWEAIASEHKPAFLDQDGWVNVS